MGTSGTEVRGEYVRTSQGVRASEPNEKEGMALGKPRSGRQNQGKSEL